MESKESPTLESLAVEVEFEKQCSNTNRTKRELHCRRQFTWDFKKNGNIRIAKKFLLEVKIYDLRRGH